MNNVIRKKETDIEIPEEFMTKLAHYVIRITEKENANQPELEAMTKIATSILDRKLDLIENVLTFV